MDAYHQSGSAIFLQRDRIHGICPVPRGRAEKRVVKIARRNRIAALVSDGLRTEDRVVLYPSDAVKNGVQFKPLTPPSA